jgi:hypothetical protein
MPQTKLDRFTTAYVETALWSSTDDEGEPLDAVHTIDDIAPETLSKMIADAEQFQKDNQSRIAGNLRRAGHDFWLTRNRHGAGFWDGDWGNDGEFLTEVSHAWGEFDLYVGDDGLIHGTPL